MLVLLILRLYGLLLILRLRLILWLNRCLRYIRLYVWLLLNRRRLCWLCRWYLLLRLRHSLSAGRAELRVILYLFTTVGTKFSHFFHHLKCYFFFLNNISITSVDFPRQIHCYDFSCMVFAAVF